MARTIVVSDLHGHASPLLAAIERSGLTTSDRLIVAGDLIDVGPEDAIGLAESYGAEVLVGNHELAAAVGLRISPQNADSVARGPEFAERMLSGDWKLASAAGDHLITHAGVSSALSDIIRSNRGLDELTADLNRRFVEELEIAVSQAPLSWEDLDRFRLLGSPLGPLWFRPFDTSQLPSGMRQIVGHTAPELLRSDLAAAIRSAGWYLIEPGGHGSAGGVAFRYAVVEDGHATVFEG